MQPCCVMSRALYDAVTVLKIALSSNVIFHFVMFSLTCMDIKNIKNSLLHHYFQTLPIATHWCNYLSQYWSYGARITSEIKLKYSTKVKCNI
jgi:hypothetical protein